MDEIMISGSWKKQVYFARALQSRPFALLWTGQTISALGDGIFTTALAWEVLIQTGSSTAMGVVIIARSLPMLAFLLIGGVAADRLSRRLVMLYSDGGRAFILFLIVLLGLVHLLQLWYLIVLSFLFGIISGFFNPAYQALPKLLVEAKELPSAIALKGLGRQASILFGPLLGAGCVAVGGPLFAFVADGLTFVFSAICLFAIKIPNANSIYQESVTSAIPYSISENFTLLCQRSLQIFRDVHEGIIYVRNVRWLWVSIVISAISNIGIAAPLAVAFPKLVQESYGEGIWLLGTLVTVSALGSILAALLIGQKHHFSKRGLILYTVLAICGIALILLGFPLPHVFVFVTSVIAEIVIGFSLSTFDVLWETLLQESIPNDKLGRISSIDILGSYCLLPVGYALTGILSDMIGPAWIFIIGGLVTLILACFALCMRDIRSL